MLTMTPEQYKVGDILRLTEGALAPVACIGCVAEKCNRMDECRTFSMWERFYTVTNEYFYGITLADLMQSEI